MDVAARLKRSCARNLPNLVCFPDATVYDAVVLMAEKNVGALLVMENERSSASSPNAITRAKSCCAGSDLANIRPEIMSTDLTTANPRETVEECLRFMTDKRIPPPAGDRR
jgi:CBS domain-containing protein